MQVSGDEPPHDTVVPVWASIYCSVHFVLVLYGSNEVARLSKSGLPYLTVVAVVAYLIFALTNFGLIFDLRYILYTYTYCHAENISGNIILCGHHCCHSLSSRQVGGKLEVLRLSVQLLADWLLIRNSISTGMACIGTYPIKN